MLLPPPAYSAHVRIICSVQSEGRAHTHARRPANQGRIDTPQEYITAGFSERQAEFLIARFQQISVGNDQRLTMLQDAVNQGFAQMLVTLRSGIERMNERLERVEGTVGRIDERLERVEAKVDDLGRDIRPPDWTN